MPGKALLTLGQGFGKMVGYNDSGRRKESMVEPVHVFEVSHFMSFRQEGGGGGEGREGGGGGRRGEEREGERGKGKGKGERRGEEEGKEYHKEGKEDVNFSGGVKRVPARRQVATYTEVDFPCSGYNEFCDFLSLL